MFFVELSLVYHVYAKNSRLFAKNMLYFLQQYIFYLCYFCKNICCDDYNIFLNPVFHFPISHFPYKFQCQNNNVLPSNVVISTTISFSSSEYHRFTSYYKTKKKTGNCEENRSSVECGVILEQCLFLVLEFV